MKDYIENISFLIEIIVLSMVCLENMFRKMIRNMFRNISFLIEIMVLSMVCLENMFRKMIRNMFRNMFRLFTMPRLAKCNN